jgi:catechol 2,3-dioxygenase-like lactoylglutathione lyase family enzyme
MIRAIDHVVIGVRDADAAAGLLADRLGLDFTAGGEHPGLGTRNRIAFLGEPYLELLAVDDAERARGSPLGVSVLEALERGEGLVTYALLDDQIEESVRHLKAQGSAIGPVLPGHRRRPDGELVEWSTAMFAQLGPDRPPFLIKHRYIGAEWGADALTARHAHAHPLGSPALLVRLDLATPDPSALAADYFSQLALEFWAVADLAVASIGPHTVRLVPTREMEVPASVTIGAAVESPRSVEALGMRFEVEPRVLPLAG